jgi:hypothetical protein
MCEKEDFASGAAFAEFLKTCGSRLSGVIIPMEIGSGNRCAQELFGLDLLEWTRWSCPLLERIPVLVVSWLSFERLQRLRPTLLLAQGETRFLRLPAPPKSLERFVECLRLGVRFQDGGSWEAVRGSNSMDAASTHHDLANDYYGAHRLWSGYKAALRSAQGKGRITQLLSAEIERTHKTKFEWEEGLQAKLRQPHILRFQASANHDEFPAYQSLDDQEQSINIQLLESHLLNGLTSSTRVLMIDDEFEKGWGEVLLNVLFKKDAFTYKLEHEAVYSEPNGSSPSGISSRMWARMVCVDSAERGRYWLDYWGEMPLSRMAENHPRAVWEREWATALQMEASQSPDLEDILGHATTGSVDSPTARPKDVTTIVLLDLRLDRQSQQQRIFDVTNLSSIRLRSDLKTERPSLPIIMFTASRNAITATQIMRNSTDADGWYVKEAPDVPPDDDNSAQGVFYLLDRMHLFSQLHLWYRDSLEWDVDRRLEYAHFYNNSHRDQILELIDQDATRVFDCVRAGTTGWDIGGYPTYLAFIQEQAPKRRFEIEITLVARRVALGTLLLTATAEAGELRWNAEMFNRMLPGSPHSRNVKAVYDKLNFNRVLWLRTRDIHTQLLSQEVEWLRRIEWPAEKRYPIDRFLKRAYSELS